MANSSKGNQKSTWDKVKSKLMTYHLPIILLLAIGTGIFFPQPGMMYINLT